MLDALCHTCYARNYASIIRTGLNFRCALYAQLFSWLELVAHLLL